MKLNKKVTLLLLSLPFVLGYRVIPGGNQWRITSTDSKVYLKFCSNLNLTKNDISDTGDLLYGQTLTHTNVVASIVNNYTNVASSFITLADSATDGSYNATTHAERLITICNGGTGSMAGYAQQTINSSGYVTACTITMGSMSGEAKSLIRTLSHEIGHCLGLDHSQETRSSLMSYFSDASIIRLQDDDKAGLAYLYPADTGYSRQATLGLSCAAQ